MADGSNAPDPVAATAAPPPPPPQQGGSSKLAGSGKTAGAPLGGLDSAIRDATGELKKIGEKQQSTDQRVEAIRDQIKPPELKQVPPPTVKSTDPRQQWASTAMFAAAIGSLFTRQPLMTAVNAAAEVLNAYKQNDAAAADAAFKTWKASEDNAQAAYQYQSDVYKATMGRLDHLEEMSAKEAETARATVNAELTAYAHSFSDQVMLQRLQQDGALGAARLNIERDSINERKLEAAGKLAQMHDYMQARARMQADPKWRALAKTHPMEAYRQLQSIAPGFMKPMTEEQEASRAAEIRKELDGSKQGSIGSHYEAVRQALPALLGLEKTSAVRDGVTKQTVDADLFTQLFNGGRAIRGFQMKMLNEHASLLDKADVAMRQLTAGGHLSGAQVRDMIEAAKLYAVAVDQLEGAAVHHGQLTAMKEGISDPSTVVPFGYDANAIRQTLGLPTGQQAGGGGRPAAPKPGEVRDGYRFKSGDPADPKSWEKA
jgi:hypothetical protein